MSHASGQDGDAVMPDGTTSSSGAASIVGTSDSPATTAEVGRRLAALLGPGDVISLAGPLGAGKTCLVQGLAGGLGVAVRVTSPTFVLVRRYDGDLPLVHVDAYRLDRATDLAGLDDDVLDETVVTCVEWGDSVREALPLDRLDVQIGVAGDHGDAPRLILLTPSGPAWTERVPALQRMVVSVLDAADADAAVGVVAGEATA
jgi:tRNA threonylcarbamoyladenosine biosynthesis protein TsaE